MSTLRNPWSCRPLRLARVPKRAQMALSYSSVPHPIAAKLASHPKDKVAIRHVKSGKSYTYGQLVDSIDRWRGVLDTKTLGRKRSRVAIMGENSFQFVSAFFASLMVPGIFAVPMCTNHTDAEIQYQLDDSDAKLMVTPDRFAKKLLPFGMEYGREVLIYEDYDGHTPAPAPALADGTGGYILYTSGTSGKPKGVVTSLFTYLAQADALTRAWDINSETAMLQSLPLHHVHGLVIGMTLPLLAGGRVEFLYPFDAKSFTDRITDTKLDPINTYTAVPTIYSKLVGHIGTLSEAEKQKVQTGLSKIKLAMCGSAALPDPLRSAWDEASAGKVPLVERYGMTETGITVSQPLNPAERIRGSVGKPVASVDARIVDPETQAILYSNEGEIDIVDSHLPGELQLQGPVLFSEYWRKPEATYEVMTEDGWFCTGDIARADEDGNIYILGRASMDIIKSGGEKLSALEIEREILGIPQIAECSVVGVPSEEWGQEVAVVAVLSPEGVKQKFGLDELKTELRKTVNATKIPKRMLTVDAIPRNQMGKVNKKGLLSLFE